MTLCSRLAPAMAMMKPLQNSLLKSAFRSKARYCSGVKHGMEVADAMASSFRTVAGVSSPFYAIPRLAATAPGFLRERLSLE